MVLVSLDQQEEVEEDDAAALRRPANDITAKLKIDFGSLGRPSRGTRGRGGRGRGGPAARPETVSPQKLPEKVCLVDWVLLAVHEGFQTTVEGSKVSSIHGASCICELHYNCLLGFVLYPHLDAGIPLS